MLEVSEGRFSRTNIPIVVTHSRVVDEINSKLLYIVLYVFFYTLMPSRIENYFCVGQNKTKIIFNICLFFFQHLTFLSK